MLLPCNDRLYGKDNDGLSKHDHVHAMLATAMERGFAPTCVVFDSWYASLDNLKARHRYGWPWLTQLTANRFINPDGTCNRPLDECAISEAGTQDHLQGYGCILIFLIVVPDGDREYGATSDAAMDELTRLKYAEWTWGTKGYHRDLKQYCDVERAQCGRRS